MSPFHRRAALALAACLIAGPTRAPACTRCVHVTKDGAVYVARSMDWVEDPGSEVWCFPRGMARDGAAGGESLEWKSKHGSLVCSFYGIATVDGINEQGLVANVLYLAESDYGKAVAGRPNLSIAAWAQYVLDSFATVDEAVEALAREPFTVVAPVLPNGAPATGHMALSDPTGDSAILEYVSGKLVIHHGRQFRVMTNSPVFEDQLALNAYWDGIGGAGFLPGTSRASDRFARASFFVKSLPAKAAPERAVAELFSVIRAVSVPLGIKTPGQPDVASTVWRTVFDQTGRIMYFDSATSPTVFWVPLEKLDFAAGAPVRRLELVGGKTYGGDASAALKSAEPFTFLTAKPQ